MLAALPDEPPVQDDAKPPRETTVLILGRYRDSENDLP